MSLTQSQRERLGNNHKLRQFQLTYPRYIIQKAEQNLKDILIPIIKSKMQNKDYDQKIIDSTRIGNVNINMNLGNIIYDVICDYVTVSNFDISEVREKTGTVDHFIKPTTKKALRFIAHGVEVFSKGHWVKGIIASHIIEDTMKEQQPIIEKKLQNEASILFERIMGVKL